MKIAVHCQHSGIAGCFSERPEFVFFEIEQGTIRRSVRRECLVPGLAAACDALLQEDADLLICGRLPREAEQALTAAGLLVLHDLSGDARSVVEHYLAGTLPL